MMRLLPASGCALALLLAAAVHAQNPASAVPQCPGGRYDDLQGTVVSVTLGAHPSRAADIIDSVLVKQGYVIRAAPPGEGRWELNPATAFVEGTTGVLEGVAHPGVRVIVATEARADSTHVQVAAATVCPTLRNGVQDGDAETSVELVHAVMLTGSITERADSLAAAGVDLAAAVERAPAYEVTAPDEAAGFRRIGRHDYEDPAAGTNMRYGRKDGSYIDMYFYPGTPPRCDAACGAQCVNEEADGFLGDFPELIRRGYYGRMTVRADEPVPVPAGAARLFGRHITLDVELRGQAQESHYYLFAFPGYKVKVRATFPPDAEMTAAVQAFVEALLPAMVSES